MKANNMNEIYYKLCQRLINKGEFVWTPDQGKWTHECRNIQFTLTDIRNNIPMNRGISLSYAFAELTWYFMGSQSMKYISQFASLWKHISDDGVTNNSAYGYILQHKHGFNQVEKIIELLKKDKASRRAVLNINTPNVNVIETKDEPCTIALQFLIRNNKLYCTAIMRSNDIWFGTPYDVIFFTELQKYIANRLGCEYGEYTHFATSFHAYDHNIECIKVVKPKSDRNITLNVENLITHMNEIYIKTLGKENAKEIIIELFENYGIFKEENNEN